MSSTSRRPGRRTLPLLAVSATVVLCAGFAIDAAGASAQNVDAQAQSKNWAGYVVHSNSGENFSSVSGSWTQPSVSASAGQGYSAFWVGLGGAGESSQALEQIGTAADVVDGQTQYYAWYELVPAPETRLDLPIQAGDHISAKVSVNGTQVTVSLSDQTSGKSVTKTLQTSNADTSSAEWIAEAPSTAQGGGYQVLPLADFNQVTFGNASATAGAHTGTISDPAWSTQQVQLSSSGGSRFPDGGIPTPAGFVDNASGQASGDASPSQLSGDGSSFAVAYNASGDSVPASSTGDASGYPSGPDASGYPSGADGSGYPSGDSSGYPSDSYGYGDGSGDQSGGYGDGSGYSYVVPGGYAIGF